MIQTSGKRAEKVTQLASYASIHLERKKATRIVAKAHRKIRNQQRDFHHKAARHLVDTYETIVFEDLSIHEMMKRPKPKQDEHGKYLPNGAAAKGGLNKSIQDAGWASLIETVSYKAAWAGVNVYKVNPNKTSQMCSACHKGFVLKILYG